MDIWFTTYEYIYQVSKAWHWIWSKFWVFHWGFFGCFVQHMEIPGPGIRYPSCSFDLYHCCINAGFLTHYVGQGIEPVSHCSRDTISLIEPQQELLKHILKHFLRNSLVVQQVKDLALSLQQLGSLLWCGFDPWPWELPYVVGTTKNKQTNKNPKPQTFLPFIFHDAI